MARRRTTPAKAAPAQVLRLRLQQAEETLRAISQGEVDAFLVADGRGPRVVVLEGVNASPPAASPPAAPGVPLSRRERQVLMLLAQGHSNRAVAERLELSVKTVETYRTRLGGKLGLRTRADLFRYSIEAGILEPGAAAPPGRRPGV